MGINMKEALEMKKVNSNKKLIEYLIVLK